MPARVVVVGSLNMDLVGRVPRIPQPGETIIGTEFHTVAGGKGANQAVAAVRLGAWVSMVGRVGKDPFGRQLVQALDSESIDHDLVIEDPEAATGVALITVEERGQNSITVLPGANMRLAPMDLMAAESILVRADVLLLQLECPLVTVIRAVATAHSHDVLVVLNPAPAQPLPHEILRWVDVLVPNESEATLLTGIDVCDVASARQAAAKLREMGAIAVVITLGAEGALIMDGEGTVHAPGFEVRALDCTGAGDAFVAALGVALAERKTLAEAVLWGNAAGALAATRLGAQPSLPRRVEVMAMLDQ